MSAVTYGENYAAAAGKVAAPRKKNWFVRVLDHVIEARMQQAAAQVERHLGYLPDELREQYRRAIKPGQ